MTTSTHSSAVTRHFSGTYAEARAKFLEAASGRGALIESFVNKGHRGALGEELATDVALLGAVDAKKLLLVTSGTHGPEGFCGSGAQVATLHDEDLLSRLQQAGVALLLVHGVNPYGFSHLHRTNEDNIDLNRNHIDFSAPLPVNAEYANVEPLALPASWPPTPADQAAADAYIEKHGMRAFRTAITKGQYGSPDGLFYGGTEPTWSNKTIRAILRKYAASATHLGWIDVHTGLGPYGHGEKVYPGRNTPKDLALARAWWGADVFALFSQDSVSAHVSGPVVSAAYDECPQARIALMGLEFGTIPDHEMLFRLSADTWLRRHGEAPESQRREIRQQLRDAFYCDNDEWKGMVLGQTRVVLLQTLLGLRAT
ncbi:M14 family metallopeptidase [Variovorax sp. efr-133-TYG-130]|uniref:M14 family metallopeptidase n=1 Tax=Variovorax sp. efr-133-TYG-130 TaxID=3040327 RepID=UPI0025541742|nr:M14 family metallopeptidase [Variovorax sp. efr-133-TYG-130]